MHKHLWRGTFFGAVAVLALGMLVYQNFSDEVEVTEENQSLPIEEAPVPESVEGIVAEIQNETTLDLVALDDEESAASAEIQSDTQTLNDLSESYDENSL